jgi:hypothetical protein
MLQTILLISLICNGIFISFNEEGMIFYKIGKYLEQHTINILREYNEGRVA